MDSVMDIYRFFLEHFDMLLEHFDMLYRKRS